MVSDRDTQGPGTKDATINTSVSSWMSAVQKTFYEFVWKSIPGNQLGNSSWTKYNPKAYIHTFTDKGLYQDNHEYLSLSLLTTYSAIFALTLEANNAAFFFSSSDGVYTGKNYQEQKHILSKL